jgi:CubicO group peptidase (beta-lactamase class C family)
MNRYRRIAGAVSILAFVIGCTSQDDPNAGVETGEDIAVVDAAFASWDSPGSPGCALAVAQDGALVYSRGYGYANLDYDIPITPQTVFDVASINKQFVAASLTMLALEDKLSFDDNIRKWLPELPEYEWPMTLRHMIYHTSGLRDYLTLFPLAGRNDYYPISHAQILAMMSRQRALISRPGDQYRYSNTAYMLLALVVERASGKSLGEFTEERIFEPLGMAGSLMYDNFEGIIPRRATGYDRDDDGRVRMVHNYNFDVPGDGQLYSTVEDLLRWDNYLHGAEKPAIYSAMLTEGTPNNGDPSDRAMGLFLDEYRGLRTIHHTGGSWGSRSALMRFVEPGLSIAIACNDGYSYPRGLAWQVADHYLADQLAPEIDNEETSGEQQVADTAHEAPSLTSVQLAEYAGEYFSPELDATYRFTVVDDGLVVRIEQEPPLEVVPVADDRFEISFHPPGWSEPGTISLEFDRNRAGAVTGLSLSMGSERGIVFEIGDGR